MESPAEFFDHRRRLIAENLVARLDELGTSQGQLARMVDVAPKVVWRWCHGQHAPSDRYLRRIEKVLDVPTGYFTAEHSEENAA
jgi:transcriptional regulator with XRE-family HTH domain